MLIGNLQQNEAAAKDHPHRVCPEGIRRTLAAVLFLTLQNRFDQRNKIEYQPPATSVLTLEVQKVEARILFAAIVEDDSIVFAMRAYDC